MAEYALRLANSVDTIERVRKGDALGLMTGGVFLARAGLRPDGGGAVAVVNGTMSVSVAAFAGWVDGGVSDAQGGYPFFLDAGKTLAIAAGHASLVRVDTVVAQVRDNAYDASGFTDARVYVVQGTPGAGAPAVPQSAIPLRDISVHAGASSGSGGLTGANLSTDRRQYVTGLGGCLPVSSQAERDALSAGIGQHVYRLDTTAVEVLTATGWVPSIGVGSAWTNVTFTGTWINFGGVYQNVQYRRVGNTVKVRGVTKSGVSGTSVFTLPVGFRPAGSVQYAIPCAGAFGSVEISATDGTVKVTAASTASAHLTLQFETD